MKTTKSPWLVTDEAAAYLRVHKRTLLKWTLEGKVKGHKLSGTLRTTWLWRESDLDAALTGGCIVGSNVVAGESDPLLPEEKRRGVRNSVAVAA